MSKIVNTRVDERDLAVALAYLSAHGVQVRTYSQLVATALATFAISTNLPRPSKEQATTALQLHFVTAETAPTVPIPNTSGIAEMVQAHLNKDSGQ